MKRYVIYTRVSTAEQGKSGLGLEAQQRDIHLFLHNFSEMPWEIIGEFQDVQSGKVDDRPELLKALQLARKEKAELLVSKLDRLSRDVEFIARTMKQVTIRVTSMPNADNFQLHIYASLAEQERKFISARTKAALQVAKERHKVEREKDPKFNKRIGGLRDKTMKRNEAIQQKAKAEAEKAMKVVGPLRNAGQTLAAIADTLNDMEVKTSRGGQWTAMQVKRVLERAVA
jgi:DNA invertase Pin-like site-specific DNA recombinase